MKIAVINHKGGVGKTLLAVHLAFRAKELKKQLVLVDFDHQYNAMQQYSGYKWQREDVCRLDDYVTLCTGLFEGINSVDNVVFDCPPSITSGAGFIKTLYQNGVEIDLWLVPVESRSSIEGAMTVIDEIRRNYPNSRIVLVMNKCKTNSLAQGDRAEVARFQGVELYNQVIPEAKEGLTKYEQQGGKPVWDYYKGRQMSVKLRDFCDWVLKGASLLYTFKNDTGEIDESRKQFIKSPVNRKVNYGEW